MIAKVMFNSIESGGVFKYNNDIYIKLAYESVTDYMNAIDIKDGQGAWFENNDMVIRLIGKFICAESDERTKGIR